MGYQYKTEYEEYSEYEIEQFNVKMEGKEKFEEAGSVGSVEETMEVRTVIKKYGGVEAKSRTKGSGTGNLKINMHIKEAIYQEMLGSEDAGMIEGVHAYGKPSQHKTFGITEIVVDEDGTKKLKAYPNCILRNAPSTKIENGVDEVKEREMEIYVQPDKYGYGKYEALYDELEETVRDKWMTEFNPDLVRQKTEEEPVDNPVPEA